ncbi:hypothetical protein C5O80_12325 [Burkholderia sp. SRS-46]|nr:hypothetical protein C5O80_12325 [Burkholderia sp. SRS-46]
MTTCSGTTAASWGRQPTVKEMLHFIRASVESIRRDAANDRRALRDLVWAVRHRSIRGGRHVRRFGIEVQ